MKILFAGDLCVTRFDFVPEKSEMHRYFESIKPVFNEADFRMVNLECVLYNGESEPIVKSGPNLKGDPSFIECLKYLDVNVAGLANNHTGDYGDEAVFETIKILKENSIKSIGAGKNIDEAYLPHIFEKDGLRVAVIAACENEFGIADINRCGAAGFNLSRVSNSIKAAREKADKVIFYFHGGNEHNPFPSPEKTELYRHIADIGADAVIAMHTHCPQGYEIYNGKPIVYSMGNFFFPVKADEGKEETDGWFFGYLTELNITEGGISLEIKPYRFGLVGEPINLLEGSQKENFISRIKEISEPIGDSEKIRYLFNIWCTMAGVSYAKGLTYSEEMENDGAALCCHLKNNFSCEAHNELLTNTFNLCYSNGISKYKLLQNEIRRYQKIEL